MLSKVTALGTADDEGCRPVRTNRWEIRSMAATAARLSMEGSPGPSPTTTTRPATAGSAAGGGAGQRGRRRYLTGARGQLRPRWWHDGRRVRRGVVVPELRIDLDLGSGLLDQGADVGLGQLLIDRQGDGLVERRHGSRRHFDQVVAELRLDRSTHLVDGQGDHRLRERSHEALRVLAVEAAVGGAARQL